jgi:hypothetical protein
MLKLKLKLNNTLKFMLSNTPWSMLSNTPWFMLSSIRQFMLNILHSMLRHTRHFMMSINLCLIIRALQCYNLTISMRTPNIPPIFTLRGIRTLMRSTATFLAQPALAMRTTSRIIPILTNIYKVQSHTAHRLGITPKRRLRLPLIRTVSTLDTTPQLVPKSFNILPTSRSILTRRTNSQPKFPTLSTRTITIPGMLISTRLDLRPTIHINPTARVPTTGAPRCMLLLRQIYRRG